MKNSRLFNLVVFVSLGIGFACGLVAQAQEMAPEIKKSEDFEVTQKGKGIILKTANQKFCVGVGNGLWKQDWLCVDGVAADRDSARTICTNFCFPDPLRGSCPGRFAADYIDKIKVVLDKADEKVVYVKIKLYDINLKKIEPLHYLEMNLRIKKGVPCLFIHQRMTNFTDSHRKFYFGNFVRYLSVYATDDLEVKKMPKTEKKEWKNLAKSANWFWTKREIKDNTEGRDGLGIISFIPTSLGTYSIGPGAHIWWGYGSWQILKMGESKDYKMALMAAKNPEEVKNLYEKIKDIELSPFIYLDKKLQ